jgi:6-phosphogluconolactonase
MTTDNFSRRQFLQAGGIGVLGVFASRANAWFHQERSCFVGTYTSGKSEGIYSYLFDPVSGALRRMNSCKSVNPSFVAIGRNYAHLYAVNEIGDFLGKPSGFVSAYAIDRDGKLLITRIERCSSQTTQAATSQFSRFVRMERWEWSPK